MGKNNKLFRERMKATKPDIEEIAYRDKQPKKVEKEIKRTDTPISKYCQNVFDRKDAQCAEQKRKEKYLKEVYKIIEEENLTR